MSRTQAYSPIHEAYADFDTALTPNGKALIFSVDVESLQDIAHVEEYSQVDADAEIIEGRMYVTLHFAIPSAGQTVTNYAGSLANRI